METYEHEGLTQEQSRALLFIVNFVNGRGHMAVLQGYAGVGKTHVVSKVIELAVSAGARLCVAAPTHKALEVLRRKCSSSRGIEFRTVASLAGLHPVKKNGETTFEARGSVNNAYDLIIVDECSMLGEMGFQHLEGLTVGKTKILFVGDPAQLPPVKETPSRAFDLPESFQMTSIVRQAADNPILALSMMVREKARTDGFIILPDLRDALKQEDSRYTFAHSRDLYSFSVSADAHGFYAPILTYDNESVIRHNFALHAHYFPDAPLFGAGETVIANDAIELGGNDIVRNGESFTVLTCKESEDVRGFASFKVRLRRHADNTELTLTVAADEIQVGRRQKLLLKQMKALSARDMKHDLLYRKAKLELNDLEMFSPIRHQYASTIHKSQGSTFEAVLLDWSSFASCPPKERPALLYVAITRAAQYLVIAAPAYAPAPARLAA